MYEDLWHKKFRTVMTFIWKDLVLTKWQYLSAAYSRKPWQSQIHLTFIQASLQFGSFSSHSGRSSYRSMCKNLCSFKRFSKTYQDPHQKCESQTLLVVSYIYSIWKSQFFWWFLSSDTKDEKLNAFLLF